MSKPKILLQLDSDRQASVFDSVVAVDAGVEQLFRHGGVQVSEVRELVYGAMFTRGGDSLRHTAIFIGGSDVSAGEALLAQVERTFFGPVRVSVMLDSNGANTTAAAAVLSAGRHVSLAGARSLVLAATGMIRRVRAKPELNPWFARLLERATPRQASVALANKLARIIWALLAKGGVYQAPAGVAVAA